MYVPKMTNATIQAAAINASTQSRMSHPQKLFDELASNARPEQDADNHPIQEVLNLRHALVSITQGTIYAVIALRADSFMHSKLSLHRFHLQPLVLQV